MSDTKKWPSAKASTWLRNYADDVAGDAYKMGGEEALYACAGAAYYAVIHGIGYNTRQEFISFVVDHLKLDKVFLADALQEIEQ